MQSQQPHPINHKQIDLIRLCIRYSLKSNSISSNDSEILNTMVSTSVQNSSTFEEFYSKFKVTVINSRLGPKVFDVIESTKEDILKKFKEKAQQQQQQQHQNQQQMNLQPRLSSMPVANQNLPHEAHQGMKEFNPRQQIPMEINQFHPQNPQNINTPSLNQFSAQQMQGQLTQGHLNQIPNQMNNFANMPQQQNQINQQPLRQQTQQLYSQYPNQTLQQAPQLQQQNLLNQHNQQHLLPNMNPQLQYTHPSQSLQSHPQQATYFQRSSPQNQMFNSTNPNQQINLPIHSGIQSLNNNNNMQNLTQNINSNFPTNSYFQDPNTLPKTEPVKNFQTLKPINYQQNLVLPTSQQQLEESKIEENEEGEEDEDDDESIDESQLEFLKETNADSNEKKELKSFLRKCLHEKYFDSSVALKILSDWSGYEIEIEKAGNTEKREFGPKFMKRLCKNHGPQFRGHFEKVKQIKDAAKQPKNSSKQKNQHSVQGENKVPSQQLKVPDSNIKAPIELSKAQDQDEDTMEKVNIDSENFEGSGQEISEPIFHEKERVDEELKARQAMRENVIQKSRITNDILPTYSEEWMGSNVINLPILKNIMSKIQLSSPHFEMTDSAMKLLSEGIQYHLKNVFESAIEISRKRSNRSAVSTYTELLHSMKDGEIQPSHLQTASLMWGPDIHNILNNEENFLINSYNKYLELDRDLLKSKIQLFEEGKNKIVGTSKRKSNQGESFIGWWEHDVKAKISDVTWEEASEINYRTENSKSWKLEESAAKKKAKKLSSNVNNVENQAQDMLEPTEDVSTLADTLSNKIKEYESNLNEKIVTDNDSQDNNWFSQKCPLSGTTSTIDVTTNDVIHVLRKCENLKVNLNFLTVNKILNQNSS